MNIWAFLDLFSIISCVLVAELVYSRNPKDPLNRSFCVLAIALGFWAFIQFGFSLSRSYEEALIWRRLLAAWPFILIAGISFTLRLTELDWFMKTRWFDASIVLPAVVFAILEFSGHLVLGPPREFTVGWVPGTAPFSPISVSAMVWFVGNIVVMIFLVARYVISAPESQKRSHARFYFLALVIVGGVTMVDEVTIVFSLGIPYLNPIGFAVGAVCVGYAMRKYKMFSLTPMTAAESIISTMDDMLLLVDKGGKIITANNASHDTLGYREIDLIGQDASVLFATPWTWLNDILCGQEIPNRRVTDTEVTLVKKDTQSIPVSLSGTAIYDEGDKIQGVILIGRDISERKKAEAEKAELEAMYEQSQKLESIGRLAGGVAHDMNNILGAILASASFVKEEIDNASVAGKSIDDILSACQRGRDLTLNLLGFARRGKYVKSDISINHLVTETVAILRRTISKRIGVRVNLENGLPLFEGDRGQIQSVLMNICINAVDSFDTAGEVSIETRRVCLDEKRSAKLGGIKSGNYIQLKVVDNGTGMDAYTMRNAFEPFFTTKPIGKGTGLGLAMAYGVVTNHKGAITIESELGKGTTISVYFPSTDRPTPTLRSKENEENSFDHPARRDGVDGAGILLVDDEPLFQSSTKRLLTKMGHEVFVADSGYEALDLYGKNSEKIAVILLDMIMPGMDGKEVFYKLKKINPNAKILIISGFDKDDNVDRLLSHGAHGYLQKPFNMQTLSKELETIIRR
ncbi:MAG: response regulator [Deltaproteobacteria bacterium]|nr:response regulator [Deltaproteobacteria bacterium]